MNLFALQGTPCPCVHIADFMGDPSSGLRLLWWVDRLPTPPLPQPHPLHPAPPTLAQREALPQTQPPARVGWVARKGSEGPLLFLPAGVPLGGKPGGLSVATGPCCSSDHKEPAWMPVFGLPPCPCCPHPSNLPDPRPASRDGPLSVPPAPWTPRHFPHLLGGPFSSWAAVWRRTQLPAAHTTAPA